MAQTIKLKRSSSTGAKPTFNQLALGEMAINTNDGALYIKRDNGTESIVTIHDEDTLHIDTTNTRVGIGNIAPTSTLDVTGTITAQNLTVSSSATIPYDNSISGLTATTVQSAISEINNLLGGGNVGSQASFDVHEFTATASQTTFDLNTIGTSPYPSYIAGYIQVFLNGVFLSETDYTATDGQNIVLGSGAEAGDLLSVVILDSFDIANQLRVLSLDASAATNTLTIDSSSNVGIATNNPQTSLHLSKTTTGPIIRLENSTNGIGENVLIGGIEWFNNDTSGEGPNVVSAIESYSATSLGNDGYLTFSTYDSAESDVEGQRASEKMRLTTDGKVGIGTDTPTVSLHVDGTNASIGVIGTPKSDWYTTAYNGLQVADSLTLWGRASDSHMSGNYYVKDVSGVANDSYINNGYAHDLWFDNNSGDLKYRNAPSGSADAQITSWSTRLVIDSAGKVGIGNTSPASTLDLTNGIDTAERAIRIQNDTVVLLTGVEGSAGNRFVGSVVGNAFLGTTGAHGLELGTNNNVRMVIDSAGEVGIGTANPDEIVHIQGSSAAPSPVVKIQSHDTANATSSVLLMSRLADNVNKNLYMKATLGNLAITGDSGYGKVGIGTDDPNSYLGSVGLVIKNDTRPELSMVSTNTALETNSHQIRFFNADAPSDYEIAQIAVGIAEGQKNRGTFDFLVNDGASLTSALHINRLGNVGIGTDNPDGSNLHIKSTADVKLTLETDEDSNCWINFSGATSEASIGYEPSTNMLRFANAADGVTSNVRMSIDAFGKVGIGNTAPTSNLTIGSAQSDGLEFTFDSTNTYRNRIANYWNSSNDTRMDFEIGPTGNVAPTAIMSVGYGGNVGIGTTTPSDRLVVQKDSANIEPILVLKNDNTTDDNGASIDFSGKDTSGNNIIYGRIAAKYTNHATEKSHMIFTHRNDSGTFSEWMRVTHDGNVGIAHTEPKSKLSIVGDGSLNSYSGTIGIENTASDKWGSITFTDDIDTVSASSNFYLIGRGNTYADRYLSFHVPTAANYGSGSQPKFVFASSGADLLYTVEASTGNAYHKGNVGIGTDTADGKLEVTVTEGNPGLLVSSTSQDTIVNKTQTIQCMNQLSGSNVWQDVAFVGHSCTLSVIGKSIQSNDPSFGGASATATVSVQYGVGSVTHHHQQWVALNGGDVTGNIEYQYLNSGASSGSYRLQVRMPYSAGTQRIYTSITGVSVSYMFEDT